MTNICRSLMERSDENAWRLSSSRRSPTFSRYGMVASSQPLATTAGLNILKDGGNAMDAAIAVAAALQVTEPCSTGLGGDCFVLYYSNTEKKVYALNGSGRAPQASTLKDLKTAFGDTATTFPNPFDAKTVTVPGSAAGWEDAVKKWGRLSLKEVLAPAVDLAENGFPVSPLASHFWCKGSKLLRTASGDALASQLLVPCVETNADGTTFASLRGPKAGEIFRNPNLAAVLRELGTLGAARGFYRGKAGRAIVEAVQERGGSLSMKDLDEHRSTFPSPMKTRFRGVDVFEHPPNGQGLAALLALSVLEGFPDVGRKKDEETRRLHLLIESMRVAFADARQYICDPLHSKIDFDKLLSASYTAKRRKLINEARASVDPKYGQPLASTDTVSFQVVDADGNAVSMVNSNYMGFGTGIVPEKCGFSLQNRGHNFSLDPTHPNSYAPKKRPYHTIIPGMALLPSGELFATFTGMGGFMQPQSHLQLMHNMLDLGMDPQAAIDAPRFCIADGTSGGTVFFEEGVDPAVVSDLKKMGHRVCEKLVTGHARSLFGRAQIILRDPKTGVLCGGSDGRADGLALGLMTRPRPPRKPEGRR
eukprot:g2947.t1